MAEYDETAQGENPQDDAERSNDDILEEALKAFELAEEAEADNRKHALDDVKFSRLSDQWPTKVKKQREDDVRPCLTINKLPAFIRQVVNDARQNKPTIKVHPVDDNADVETAEIINGIIRNIEYNSDADVAYDTGVECAVGGGFGYWMVDIDYAFDDTFDLDILIKRIANPLSVYGDPASTAADSSDWNTAFYIDRVRKSEFKKLYPEAEMVDWEFDFQDVPNSWHDDEYVMVADYWKRTEVDKKILLLSDDTVLEESALDKNVDWMVANGIDIVGERTVRSHKVKRYKITGAEVLSEDDWPGRYIPIIPVYGDEFDIEGKRHLRSLIHDAKDAQRVFNYWRTTATELTALAPRVPFIGPKGSFNSDADKWNTANQVSWPHLEYDVVEHNGTIMPPPQRQPMDVGAAAGALQEAMNASDDMKSIIGVYDAGLGARSNEVSGRAIMARQREGDISTFHFLDNLTRAIRHTGRVVIDLIPYVYNKPRIVRIMGEDGTQTAQDVNRPVPVMGEDGQPKMQPVMGPNGQPMINPMTGQPQMEPVMKVYDLTAGKYDLIVNTGPSFTSRREEAAIQMTEMIRANPQIAPLITDLVAQNMDWPGADEIAKRLKKMLPPQIQGDQIPPQIKQQMQMMQQQLQALMQENQKLKTDRSIDVAEMQQDQREAAQKHQVDTLNAETKRFEAETKRIEAVADAYQPQEVMQPINPPMPGGQPGPVNPPMPGGSPRPPMPGMVR
jgi:hypothetical protein